MPIQKAEAEWKGNLTEGSGRRKVGSGALDGPYSFKSPVVVAFSGNSLEHHHHRSSPVRRNASTVEAKTTASTLEMHRHIHP
jgi:hypothetical protein